MTEIPEHLLQRAYERKARLEGITVEQVKAALDAEAEAEDRATATKIAAALRDVVRSMPEKRDGAPDPEWLERARRAAEIVHLLAASEPPLAEQQVQGGRFFVCTLCGGGGYEKHKVVHEDRCPWLLARWFEPDA